MSCENLNAIKIVKWKIGKSPYNFNSVMNFVQGDKNTNILEIVLDSECGDFQGLSITAIIQVPDNPSINLIATIEEGNVARYNLPQEVLHYVGSYTVNFMITQTQEIVRWSENVKIYNVIENLSVNNLPLLIPEEEQKYLDLIADLNAENTRAETNLPLLEAENERAEQNIIDAGEINVELEGTIEDAETAKTNLEGAISDSETAKGNLEQTITDSETAKTNLEGTIADAGQAQSDLQDKIDEVPALIQSITDEGDTQVARVVSEGDTQETRVTDQGNTEVARVQSQGDTSVQAVKDQETASIIAVGDKGDEEYQRLDDLIQTSPTGGNAMLLDGRTRTSFEEDIESRQYALDNRLIYAFEPAKRNIENLNYGMYVKNPLTNGDGTIKSEDADSVAGVFNDDDKNFYCGEGYENLTLPLGSTQGSPIQEYDNLILRIELTSTGVNTYSQLHYTQFLSGNNYSVSWEIIEDTNNIFQQISMHGLSFVTSESSIDIKGSMSGECNVSANANGISLLINGNVGEFITVKIQVTETSQPVPFVKATAPDGKLIIKEPWTSETHSFIFTGVELKQNPEDNVFYIYFCGGASNETLYMSNNLSFGPGDIVDIILSGSFIKAIRTSDLIEITPAIANTGLTNGKFIFAGFYSNQNTIKNMFSYEGNLTEQELRNELEKIKSGQYSVENTGVFEPVQGSKRRANEYGQYKNHIKIEKVSTDIQLVETDKIVYTEAYDGTKRRDRIDGSGLITGDGGIIDVNGYIRLDASTGATASTPVKVVIEND